MAYKALRKDLTETSRKCDFCDRHLTSLKAFVLEDEDTGTIAYSGPTCAKKKLGEGYTLSGIPDLTRFTLSDSVREAGSGEGKIVSGNSANPARLATEYLLLREEKLGSLMKTSYAVLRKYYLSLKDRALGDAEICHINNIEAKAPENLRLGSLQRCYNYLFWIDVGINKLPPEKIEFLQSVRETLISDGKISEGQKHGINKWLKNIDGVPQLK